jgi:glyoxylase-like metal-dependent hydrolase (beta-lactamase superfamily II)
MNQIVKGLYRLGEARQPAFLVMGEHKIVQIDAGPTVMGPTYLNDIKNLLGKERCPDYLFFTHFHFDHLGSAPFLCRHFPEISLGGSRELIKLLEQEKVVETITMLNQRLITQYKKEKDFFPQDLDYGALKIDRVLRNGDVVDLGGGFSIEVIATPGHSRDCLSFFLPHSRTMLTGEAAGIVPGDDFWVSPQFLSSYDDYMLSIQRIREKKPKVIVMGHHCVVQEGVEQFFDTSLSDCKEFRGKIEQYLKEELMDQGKVVQRINKEEYLSIRKGKQPKEAFLINTRAQVKLIANMMKNR